MLKFKQASLGVIGSEDGGRSRPAGSRDSGTQGRINKQWAVIAWPASEMTSWTDGRLPVAVCESAGRRPWTPIRRHRLPKFVEARAFSQVPCGERPEDAAGELLDLGQAFFSSMVEML
jgi:hypothetical protein